MKVNKYITINKAYKKLVKEIGGYIVYLLLLRKMSTYLYETEIYYGKYASY